MVPLDPLWDGGYLTPENIKKIQSASANSWCDMAGQIFGRTVKLVNELGRNPINGPGTVSPPDLLAVAVAIDPGIAEIKEYYIDLETRGEFTRGMTVLDRRTYYRIEERPHLAKTRVALSAYQKKYGALVLNTWM
jgi:inosine-uridine nucleoside N-ribohydrolase